MSQSINQFLLFCIFLQGVSTVLPSLVPHLQVLVSNGLYPEPSMCIVRWLYIPLHFVIKSGPTVASFATSACLSSFLYGNQSPVGVRSIIFYYYVVIFSSLIIKSSYSYKRVQ